MELLDVVVKDGEKYSKNYYIDFNNNLKINEQKIKNDFPDNRIDWEHYKKIKPDFLNPYNGELYYAYKGDKSEYQEVINSLKIDDVIYSLNKEIFDNNDIQDIFPIMKLLSCKDGVYSIYYKPDLGVKKKHLLDMINLVGGTNDQIKIIENVFDKNIKEILETKLYAIGIDYENDIKNELKYYFYNLDNEEKEKLETKCDKTISEIKDNFNIDEKIYVISLIFENDHIKRTSYYFKQK